MSRVSLLFLVIIMLLGMSNQLFAAIDPTCVVSAEVMEFHGKVAGHQRFRVRVNKAEIFGSVGNCNFVKVGRSINIGTILPGLRGGDLFTAKLSPGVEPGMSAMVTHILWSEVTILNRHVELVPGIERLAESQTYFY